MMGFDLSSIKTSNVLSGSFNILNDASSAVKSVIASSNQRRSLRHLASDLSLAPFLDSVTVVKVYDYSCLPSFVISKSCVVIVSAVALSADASKYNSTSFENAVYPRMQLSMGTNNLFLNMMNNSHALEILYLGNGDINLPDAPNKAQSQSAILIGSIVGSVVVGLAFLFIMAWIIYRRSQRKSAKQEMDPDEFELVEDPDTPFMDSPASPSRHDILPPSTFLNDTSTKIHAGSPSETERMNDHLDDPQLEDQVEIKPLYGVHDQTSVPTDNVLNSSTAESDLIVSRIKNQYSKDELSFDDSDASSIDDEMIQALENLIRVDDWEGISPDVENLSVSDKEDNLSRLMDDPDSTFSKEEVQSIIRNGEWEKLSKASASLEGTDISSADLSAVPAK
jgi:hypothetical protein